MEEIYTLESKTLNSSVCIKPIIKDKTNDVDNGNSGFWKCHSYENK